MSDYPDEARRHEALALAVQAHAVVPDSVADQQHRDERIVGTARMFEAYLRGEDAGSVEYLHQLLGALSDDDECSFDHHGSCQAHFGEINGKCANAEAVKLLGGGA